MTLDRYIFIARPLRYISLMTTKTAVSLICLIWLMSLLPHLVFYLTQGPSSNGLNAAFIIADFVFFEIFPIVFQIAATGHIFHIVRLSDRCYRSHFPYRSEKIATDGNSVGAGVIQPQIGIKKGIFAPETEEFLD